MAQKGARTYEISATADCCLALDHTGKERGLTLLPQRRAGKGWVCRFEATPEVVKSLIEDLESIAADTGSEGVDWDNPSAARAACRKAAQRLRTQLRAYGKRAKLYVQEEGK